MLFPRLWRTGDGGTLVERAEGSFVLFALSGAMTEAYGAWGSSDSDGMVSLSHAVEGSVLVRYSDYEADGGGCTRSSYALVRDLVAIQPEDCTVPLDGLDERVARFKQRRSLR
jgi:hypothetical protein